MSWPDVTVVDTCARRDGQGGSPASVTDDDPAATDADRRAVAATAGTSHAAFLNPGGRRTVAGRSGEGNSMTEESTPHARRRRLAAAERQIDALWSPVPAGL